MSYAFDCLTVSSLVASPSQVFISPERGEYVMHDDDYTTIPLQPLPAPDDG